jgi:hypothetical protein
MSYRPIADMWMLARAKLKPKADGSKNSYYGAYLGGFPERARMLLNATRDEPVLHVCGGMAKLYPYAGGFGPNDKTLDIDPLTQPDYLQDARAAYPLGFKAILADPPYSVEDAAKYRAGAEAYPSPNIIVNRAFEVLPVGGRVGVIHYTLPHCRKDAKVIAVIGIISGYNNRIRAYTVFEKR